jgi:hypothetical protein
VKERLSKRDAKYLEKVQNLSIFRHQPKEEAKDEIIHKPVNPKEEKKILESINQKME